MRKFLIKISYTLLPIWLFFVGITAYYHYCVAPNIMGDLGGLAKIPTRNWYTEPVDPTVTDTLYRDVTDAAELRHAGSGLLVCGDSFSQIGKTSWNNYLAALSGEKVLNFTAAKGILPNPLQTAYELMRDGYVDSTLIKTFIVESVERSLVQRICEFNPSGESGSQVVKESRTQEDEEFEEVQGGKEESSWLLTEAKNWLMLRMGIRNRVRQVQLSKSLFTSRYPDRLLYYRDDIKGVFSIPTATEPVVKTVLDSLYNMADQKGIRLILLVAPDKYDLYQDYIVDNRYARKTINEDLRRIVGPREDVVIAKELLLPRVKAGEKDVYEQGDTHWSFTSARQVAAHILEKID